MKEVLYRGSHKDRPKIYLERFESATGRRECLNTLLILYLVLFIAIGEWFGSGWDIREVAQLKVLNEGFFLRMRLLARERTRHKGLDLEQLTVLKVTGK